MPTADLRSASDIISEALHAVPLFPFDRFEVHVGRKDSGLVVGEWPLDVTAKNAFGTFVGHVKATLYTCAGTPEQTGGFVTIHRWWAAKEDLAKAAIAYGAFADAVLERLAYLLGHYQGPPAPAPVEYLLKFADERLLRTFSLDRERLQAEIMTRQKGRPLKAGLVLVSGAESVWRQAA